MQLKFHTKFSVRIYLVKKLNHNLSSKIYITFKVYFFSKADVSLLCAYLIK